MPRFSDHITQAQAENLICAVSFASEIGLPLNRLVTILWEHPQVIGRVQDVQGRLFERLRKWLNYRGVDAAYVWVLERGSMLGLHSHFLVHVPFEHLAEFKRMLPQWHGGEVERKTIVVKSVRYGAGVKGPSSEERLTHYLLKGVSERSGSLLNIKWKGQGLIMGKRIGTSQNLGLAARENSPAMQPRNTDTLNRCCPQAPRVIARRLRLRAC